MLDAIVNRHEVEKEFRTYIVVIGECAGRVEV